MLSDYKIKQLGYIRALDTEEKPVTYCKIENDGFNKMLILFTFKWLNHAVCRYQILCI